MFRHGPRLSQLVKSIRYKDTELTLRENLTAAREDATQIKLEGGATRGLNLVVTDKIFRLAAIDPAVAIIEIWKKLEAQLISLIQHNGLMRFATPAKFMERLAQLGKLSSSDLSLFRKPTEIRNESVHGYPGSSPTVAEVVEFKDFVELLIEKLEKIKEEPGYIDVPRQ